MKTYCEVKNEILDELTKSLNCFDDAQANQFIDYIFKARRIYATAAGRMGYSLRAFIMRLNHLGFEAYWIGDTYAPPMNDLDLLIVSSGSGRTASILNFIEISKKKANPKVAVITGDIESPMAKIADHVVLFEGCTGGLNVKSDDNKIVSMQPMSTLNEQATFIYFDIIASMILLRQSRDINDTKYLHFNVE